MTEENYNYRKANRCFAGDCSVSPGYTYELSASATVSGISRTTIRFVSGKLL